MPTRIPFGSIATLVGCDACSRITVQSASPSIKQAVHTMRLVQNGQHMFVGGLNASWIVMFADVPFLDFDMDLEAFCDYTASASGNPPHKPSLWQRPLDDLRVDRLAQWLGANAARCVPDAVLLGEKSSNGVNPRVSLMTTAGLQGNAYNITVENKLSDRCIQHGKYLDKGVQVFQNRCDQHDCSEHIDSTSPLQIIDGQHRIHGLFKSTIGSKDLAVIFLLLARPEEVDHPSISGFNAAAQAEIFKQVNTESIALKELHQLWLKRFFDESWTIAIPEPPGKKAFDILIQLGGKGLAKLGQPNPWQNKVKGHYKLNAREYTDTLRGAQNLEGQLGAVAHIVPDFAPSPPNPTPAQQLQNYIQGSMEAIPNAWKAPAPSIGPFESRRSFEAIIRLFPRIKAWMLALGKSTYGVGDFKAAWQLQSSNFTPNTADDWKRFVASGEQTSRELLTILELMWPVPSTPYQPPPSKPVWETQMGIVGNCPDWKTYIGLKPDPITWINPRTSFSSSTKPSRVTKPQKTVAKVGKTTKLLWEEPRNHGSDADVEYRETNGQWIELGGSGPSRDIPAELLVSPGTSFKVRVRYTNCCGYTELIANLTT